MIVQASGSYLQQLVEFPQYPLEDVLPYETLPLMGEQQIKDRIGSSVDRPVRKLATSSDFLDQYSIPVDAYFPTVIGDILSKYLASAHGAAKRLVETAPKIPIQEMVGQAKEIQHRFDIAFRTFTQRDMNYRYLSLELSSAVALVEFLRAEALATLRFVLVTNVISDSDFMIASFANRVRAQMTASATIAADSAPLGGRGETIPV